MKMVSVIEDSVVLGTPAGTIDLRASAKNDQIITTAADTVDVLTQTQESNNELLEEDEFEKKGYQFFRALQGGRKSINKVIELSQRLLKTERGKEILITEAGKAFRYWLNRGIIDFAKEISDTYLQSEKGQEVMTTKAGESFLKKLHGGYTYQAKQILDLYLQSKKGKKRMEENETEVMMSAGEGFLYELNTSHFDRAKEISDTYLQSEKGQEVMITKAGESFSNYLHAWDRNKSKEISDTYLQSEKGQEVMITKAGEAFFNQLNGKDIGIAEIIIETFFQGEKGKRRLEEYEDNIIAAAGKLFLREFEIGYIHRANELIRIFLQGEKGKKKLKEIYNTKIKEACEDKQVKENYDFMVNIFGLKYLENTITKVMYFYRNIHDNLLWIEKIRALNQDNQQKMITLLKGILHQIDFNRFDFDSNTAISFAELNEYIGYFDTDLYEEQGGGTITSREQFKREALLQKYNIIIPADASENMKDAIQTLIQAPGVDVGFLRKLLDRYELNRNNDTTKSYEYIDDEDGEGTHNFADQLIEIIEGIDKIDERQIIKPFEKIVSFDPVYRVVYEAIGFHTINQDTANYKLLINTDPTFKQLSEVRKGMHDSVVEKLQQEKKDNWKKFPDKKEYYTAEYNKQLKHQGILSTDGAKIKSLNLGNIQEDVFDEGTKHTLKNAVQQIIKKHPGMLFTSMKKLWMRKEELQDHSEMHLFKELTISFEVLVQNILGTNIGGLTKEQRHDCEAKLIEEPQLINDCFDKQLILLGMYLMYLSYNNSNREANSKTLKNEIDMITKQASYVKQNNDLKTQGYVPQNQDVTISYLKGVIALSEIDQDRMRNVIKQYGYDGVGRTMKIEILSKSDPRGWVCGDYTNCCMPFTSSKNQQYLTREDMAYFVISIVDREGNEDLVAQSVLVAAGDGKQTEGSFNTLAVDNIEIANRAIHWRGILAEGYKLLPELFGDKKIIIGASYNDDGGLVTGQGYLDGFSEKPLQGNMEYSDCFGKHNAYVYHDPNNSASKYAYMYYGLGIDSIETSDLKRYVSSEVLKAIKPILQKIGTGEDDGEGGLNFADNYSSIIKHNGEYAGYVIAADYLVDEGEKNALTIEQFVFEHNMNAEEKKLLLKEYIKRNKIVENFKRIILGSGIEDRISDYFQNKGRKVTRK